MLLFRYIYLTLTSSTHVNPIIDHYTDIMVKSFFSSPLLIATFCMIGRTICWEFVPVYYYRRNPHLFSRAFILLVGWKRFYKTSIFSRVFSLIFHVNSGIRCPRDIVPVSYFGYVQVETSHFKPSIINEQNLHKSSMKNLT